MKNAHHSKKNNERKQQAYFTIIHLSATLTGALIGAYAVYLALVVSHG